MISSEFSPQKLKRKLVSDGVVDSLVSAGDLLTRKRLGRPLFDSLVKRGMIHTVSQEELRQRASRVVDIPDERYDSPTPFVALLEGGRILSETGLSLTANCEILEESAAEPEQAQQAMMAILSRELFYGHVPIQGLLKTQAANQEVSRTLNTVAPLVPRYPNYYHWMVETVPQIRYLRAFEEATGEDVTILIPSNTPSFVNETLQLLEWPQSKVESATESEYRVRNLVIPSYPERRSTDFDWIRREVLRKASASEEAESGLNENGNNVYISRSNAIERRVLNEDEVMDVLSPLGFSRYHLEERSLEANARLFNNTDIVVGPHGAGLTDIIFAEDCTVLELFGEKVKQPYQILAETLGLEYEIMYCRAESADIVVDPDQLERRVKALANE